MRRRNDQDTLRVMSRRVYAVQYQHRADGEDYEHEFRVPVEMVTQADGSILLRSPSGWCLWEDLPA